jgi:hypothetical protein
VGGRDEQRTSSGGAIAVIVVASLRSLILITVSFRGVHIIVVRVTDATHCRRTHHIASTILHLAVHPTCIPADISTRPRFSGGTQESLCMECDVWSACWAWVHMPLDSLPRPSSPLEHTRSHRTTLGCPSTRSQLPLCLHASLVCQTVEPVHNRTAPGRKSGRKNGQRDLRRPGCKALHVHAARARRSVDAIHITRLRCTGSSHARRTLTRQCGGSVRRQ